MTDGESNINIIFDMVVPFEASSESIRSMTDKLKAAITAMDERFSVVIQIDRAFVT
jgi:hypothetical protein